MASTSETLLARLNSDAQGHSVLPNHANQSVTTIDGWKSALFSIPFLAIGIFTGWIATNGNRGGKHEPVWLIGAFGGMFFFGGLFFFVHGLLGIARKSAWRREASQYPGEPWRYDFHWHREGIAFSAFDDMLKRLLSALLWNAFLVPFAWIGAKEKGAWPFLVAAGIFGLLGLIFWYRWATRLFDLLRYGNSFLAYDSFPYSRRREPSRAPSFPAPHLGNRRTYAHSPLRPGTIRHHRQRQGPHDECCLLRALRRHLNLQPRPVDRPRRQRHLHGIPPALRSAGHHPRRHASHLLGNRSQRQSPRRGLRSHLPRPRLLNFGDRGTSRAQACPAPCLWCLPFLPDRAAAFPEPIPPNSGL